VVLFFDKIDKNPIANSLGIEEEKCCDGLIFYAREGEENRTICLVEMKGRNLKEAAEQIKNTRERLERILQKELSSCNDLLKHISWKACFYSNHSSQEKTENCKRVLSEAGFRLQEDIIRLQGRDREIGPYLRGLANANKSKNSHKSRR
jgi:hypothetical protein